MARTSASDSTGITFSSRTGADTSNTGSVSCWINPNNWTGDYVTVFNNSRFLLRKDAYWFGGNYFGIVWGQNDVFGVIDRRWVSLPSTGVWTHVVASVVSNNVSSSGEIYINGVLSVVGGAQTAQGYYPSFGTTFIGWGNYTGTRFDGGIADVCVWNGTALTAAQAASLATGVSPMEIGTKPTFYAPLVRDLQDLMHETPGSDSGTPTYFDHPRLYKQGRRSRSIFVGGAPPSPPPPPTVFLPAFAA